MGTIGERVRAERIAAGISQEELAAEAKVSKQAISKIENGTTAQPAATTMDPIARRLGVNATWLLTGRGKRTLTSQVHDPEPARTVRPDPARMAEAYKAVLIHAGLAERVIYLTRPDDMAIVCEAYAILARGGHVLPGEESSSELEALIRARALKPGGVNGRRSNGKKRHRAGDG